MSKVFIIQDSFYSRDYSSAHRYGSLHFLLEKEHSPSKRPSDCILTIDKKLREGFNPDEDYITWSGGDPLANLMVGIVLGVNRIKKFTFLRWEKERDLEGNRKENIGFYTPVTIKCY